MSNEYPSKVYCHCVQSLFNKKKLFTYQASNDLINGQYTSLTEAQSAALEYDMKSLYLIPTTQEDSSTIFTFKEYNNTTISLTGLLGVISSSNKTAVPQLTNFDSSTTNKVAAIYNIYQKTYKVTITKPDNYTASELASLINNMNRVFNIKLPKEAGTYIYDKNKGTWERTAV